MDKREILKEFEEEFEKLRSRLGFSVTLEDLDYQFNMRDSVLEQGYVRVNVSMQVASRIVDYFRNWSGYLNSLMMPAGASYPGQTEAKLFNSEEDKREMWDIIKICMKYYSMFSFMFLKKDEEMQAKFIDEAYLDWKNVVRPYMSKIMDRVYVAWRKD